MSDFYTCKCGERVHDKSYHECPGTPNDRLDGLEREVRDLRAVVEAMARLSVLGSAGPHVDEDRETVRECAEGEA